MLLNIAQSLINLIDFKNNKIKNIRDLIIRY